MQTRLGANRAWRDALRKECEGDGIVEAVAQDRSIVVELLDYIEELERDK